LYFLIMGEIIMDERLKQAYELLKQGQRPPALALIMQVIREDRDNADAWYLLAVARNTANEKREALEQTLRLNPNHQAAQHMQQKWNAAQSPQPSPQPPQSPSTPPRSIVESTEEDTWHDAWNTTASTLIGMAVLIIAMTFPLSQYIKLHTLEAGLLTLIPVVGFCIAGVRWATGKAIDGRGILPVVIFTGIIWFILIANFQAENDKDPQKAKLFFILFYGIIILGWATSLIPFGPRLKQSLANWYDHPVHIMGTIGLGEIREYSYQNRTPFHPHVFLYHGQVGDWVNPLVYKDGVIGDYLRSRVFAWVTAFGYWGKLVPLGDLTLNKANLPYTGVYAVVVEPLHYKKDKTDIDNFYYAGYRLEMTGGRDGANKASSLSSLYFVLRVLFAEKLTQQLDPAYHIKKKLKDR
jgi:hypothetical protein